MSHGPGYQPPVLIGVPGDGNGPKIRPIPPRLPAGRGSARSRRTVDHYVFITRDLPPVTPEVAGSSLLS
jgi:hypothetical protein